VETVRLGIIMNGQGTQLRGRTVAARRSSGHAFGELK